MSARVHERGRVGRQTTADTNDRHGDALRLGGETLPAASYPRVKRWLFGSSRAVRGRGCPGRTRVNPSMGLIAACACALSCAHGKTGVGLLPNPSGVYARPMLLKVRPGHPRPRPLSSLRRPDTRSKASREPGHSGCRSATHGVALRRNNSIDLTPSAFDFLSADACLSGGAGWRG